MGSWWLREPQPMLAFIRYRLSCSLTNHTQKKNVIRNNALEHELDVKNLAPNRKLDNLFCGSLQL